jgi:hypothetical protein
MTVWYRKSKAKVSPADAAYFDDLRAGDRHPAADYGDLPEEAQSYISQLRVQYLDLARERYFSSGAMWGLLGIVTLVFAHFDGIGRYLLVEPSAWDYIIGLFFVALGTARFVQGQRFDLPDVNECMREDWEIDFVTTQRRGSDRPL